MRSVTRLCIVVLTIAVLFCVELSWSRHSSGFLGRGVAAARSNNAVAVTPTPEQGSAKGNAASDEMARLQAMFASIAQLGEPGDVSDDPEQARVDLAWRALKQLPDGELTRFNLPLDPSTIILKDTPEAERLFQAWEARQQELKHLMSLQTDPSQFLSQLLANLTQHLQVLLPTTQEDNEGQSPLYLATQKQAESVLIEVQSLLSDLDVARDLQKLNGWSILVSYLSPRLPDRVRSLAAWAIGTAVQNVEEFQEWILIPVTLRVEVLKAEPFPSTSLSEVILHGTPDDQTANGVETERSENASYNSPSSLTKPQLLRVEEQTLTALDLLLQVFTSHPDAIFALSPSELTTLIPRDTQSLWQKSLFSLSASLRQNIDTQSALLAHADFVPWAMRMKSVFRETLKDLQREETQNTENREIEKKTEKETDFSLSLLRRLSSFLRDHISLYAVVVQGYQEFLDSERAKLPLLLRDITDTERIQRIESQWRENTLQSKVVIEETALLGKYFFQSGTERKTETEREVEKEIDRDWLELSVSYLEYGLSLSPSSAPLSPALSHALCDLSYALWDAVKIVKLQREIEEKEEAWGLIIQTETETETEIETETNKERPWIQKLKALVPLSSRLQTETKETESDAEEEALGVWGMAQGDWGQFWLDVKSTLSVDE